MSISATPSAKPRTLYVSDTLTYMYSPRIQPDNKVSAGIIYEFVELLKNSGVDTFLVNPNFSTAWYPSKRVASLLAGYTRGDRSFFAGHPFAALAETYLIASPASDDFVEHCIQFYNQYLDLIEAGVDWLEETCKACRKSGIRPWASVRMNDMHGQNNLDASFLNNPLLRQSKYRIADTAFYPGQPYRQGHAGLNYEHQEVKDYMKAQIAELVEDYDFEGIELDWLRNPICCEPGASRETIDRMTAWIGEIREMTRQEGAKRGFAYTLGLRLPANFAALKRIGLDIAQIVDAGLVDYISPSNFWQSSWDMPHDRLKQWAAGKCAVYGMIEDGFNWLPVYSPERRETRVHRLMSATPEMVHGNAAGKLALGADAIELFNFYATDSEQIPGLCADYSCMLPLNRLELLRGKPKQYTLSTFSPTYSALPYETTEQLPAILEAGWRRGFRMVMCAEPAAGKSRLVIQIVLKKLQEPFDLPIIGVSFNQSSVHFSGVPTDRLLFANGPYTHHTAEHAALNFSFDDLSLIEEGWNEVTVYTYNVSGRTSGPRYIHVASIEAAVYFEPE